ncbi:MAG: glycosyltransferase family 4 protein [Pontiellaceae bacterium]|jgi:glycosyltransferase involved in cell wall biosynthesis|nr:glycosyltransferase family 4 protein [Pontiellaceae bacterium]
MKYLKPILLGEFQPQLFASLFPGQPVPNLRGGTAVVNLVRAHLEQGLPVDVVTLNANATEPIIRLKSDVLNIWIVRRRPSRAVRDGFRQERKLIEDVLRDSDADVCHAHWTYEYGMAAIAQKIKPFVVTVHDHSRNILFWQGWRYAGLYLLTQYVLRKATGRLTAVSPYVAEYAAKVSGQPVTVIANVVAAKFRVSSFPPAAELPEADEFRETEAGGQRTEDRGQRSEDRGQISEDRDQTSEIGNRKSEIINRVQDELGIAIAGQRSGQPETRNSKLIIPESSPILITLADSGRLKNIKRALAAFSSVRKKFPQAQYRLVGNGLDVDGPMQRWAVKKGLDEGVQFCGWMPYDQAMALLRAADVVFHPSLEESFGYPVAEALATGVPAVAARQAKGCAWLLDGGKYGVLADGRSASAMGEALCNVLSRPDAERIKMAGREHIQELCNGSAVLEQYQTVFHGEFLQPRC